MKTVWICAASIDYGIDFVGVFSSEKLALAHCTTLDHFVGPAVIDEVSKPIPQVWTGSYYPLQNK